MQDEHPPAGQERGKLCLRPATACDPALRSGHFRSKVSLLSGNHGRNITLASKMTCPTTNFAKGSIDIEYGKSIQDLLQSAPPLFTPAEFLCKRKNLTLTDY